MYKRILAFMLCVVFMFEPLTVLADIAKDVAVDGEEEIEIVDGLKYQLFTIDKYYTEMDKDNKGTVDTGKVFFNKKAAEVVPTISGMTEKNIKASDWPDEFYARYTANGKRTSAKPNFNMFGVKSSKDDTWGETNLVMNLFNWRKLKASGKNDDLSKMTFGDSMLALSDTYENSDVWEKDGDTSGGTKLDSWLSKLSKEQGGSGADLSNLNQRMASFLYKHIQYAEEMYDKHNGKYLWADLDDIDDAIYKTYLSDTLALGHGTSLKKSLKDIGLIQSKASDDLAVIGRVRSVDESFAVTHMGVLAYNPIEKHSYTGDDTVGLANFMGIIICLDEYIEAYKDLGNLAKGDDWQNDEGTQGTLVYLRTFHDAFAPMIPLIEEIYHLANKDADDKSMADMYSELSDEVKNLTLSDAITVETENAQVLSDEDLTSPISQFYLANQSAVGIINVNRDEVLNDVQPDMGIDSEVEAEVEEDRFNVDTTLEKVSATDKDVIQMQRKNIKLLYLTMNMDYWTKDGMLDKAEDDESIYEKWEKSLIPDIKGQLWNYFFKEATESNSKKLSQTPVVVLSMLEKEYEKQVGHTAEEMFGEFSLAGEATESDKKQSAESLFNFLKCRVCLEKIIEWRKVKDTFTDQIELLTTNLKDSAEDMEDVAQAVNANVSSDGTARGYSSVLISDFIRKGMSLSATYTPMCTVLDKVTIDSDLKSLADSRFTELYERFGYQRKALQIDISASSALDYYTAGGRAVGQLKTATLRDLVYSGENDVTLYIDRGLYNTERVKEDGSKLLEDVQKENEDAYDNLRQYVNVSSVLDPEHPENLDVVNTNDSNTIATDVLARNFTEVMNDTSADNTVYSDKCTEAFEKIFAISIKEIEDQATDVGAYIDDLNQSIQASTGADLTDEVLKAGKITTYDEGVRAVYSRDNGGQSAPELRYSYHNVSQIEPDYVTDDNPFVIDEGVKSSKYKTFDNKDTLTMSSYYINKYLGNKVNYSENVNTEQGTVTNNYSTSNGYSPLLPLAYISCLYRDSFSYHVSTATGVMTDNPVFMASDKLLNVDGAGQWYRNTFLNYVLMQNLKGMSGMDATFMSEMDCPVYMDIFGNIVTQSNRVVIPAACNATLHVASYYKNNYALGLYKSYGKSYSVPWDTDGAASVLGPMFVADQASGTFVLNGVSVIIDGKKVNYKMINDDDAKVKDSIQKAYLSTITSNNITRLNWMAMVNIINEVMRGAPFAYIDFENEVGLNTTLTGTAKSGLVAAAKLENLIASLKSTVANTLLYIPDFTKMENLSVYFAFFLKILIVVLTAVILVAIYRDAVALNLGWHTVSSCVWAVALTIIAVVGIPAVFNATYYSTNKILLEDETYKILMMKEEKRQIGEETGVTSITNVRPTKDFLIQMDWVKVPWYRQFENTIFEDTLSNTALLRREEMRKQSPIYNQPDVTLYNDGVYMNVEDLFDSVQMDYTFPKSNDDGIDAIDKGLYLYATENDATMSYYSPYYVFLRALTANVNEFNAWRGVAGHRYAEEDDANIAVSADSDETACYSYTTKLMSGNRKKTVGLSNNYFTSEQFLQEDKDLLRLNQVYMALPDEYYDYDGNKIDVKEGWDGEREDVHIGVLENGGVMMNDVNRNPDTEVKDTLTQEEIYEIANPAKSMIRREEESAHRALVFNDSDRQQFVSSYWFNDDIVESDLFYIQNVHDKDGNTPLDGSVEAKELREEYVAEILDDYYSRVDSMDDMLREFVTENRGLLTKVTDETFIKVTALAMSIYYNQLFGVPSANSVELYNMSSEDILRLCVSNADDAILAAPLSFPRFVYNEGGTPAVYAAAFVSIILWLGSYIKPICTIVVWFVIFISIFVFRVVLQRPSANLWGYCETVGLLCFTNIVHSLLLKVSMYISSIGLSPTGCLIFVFISQLVYICVLAWVVGVSLRDWQNLGAGIYERKTVSLRNKFKKEDDASVLKHPRLDNNWDYYNKLRDDNIKRNLRYNTVSTGNAHTTISNQQ